MTNLNRVVVTLLFFSLASPALAGGVYKWVDKDGSIHFTDDPSNIPAVGRSEIKTVIEEPEERSIGVGGVYTADLTQSGMSFYVRADINSGSHVNLLIDSGAAITILTEKTARSLGLPKPSGLPKMRVITAGGKSWIRLVTLKSVNVGGAIVEDVEAGITDQIGGEIDGLLGMSFLGDFVYQIDSGKKKLELTNEKPDSEVYGGHGKEWWARKFKRVDNNRRLYSYYNDKAAKGLLTNDDREKANIDGMSKNEINRVTRYYKDLHSRLFRKAINAKVPAGWRISP